MEPQSKVFTIKMNKPALSEATNFLICFKSVPLQLWRHLLSYNCGDTYLVTTLETLAINYISGQSYYIFEALIDIINVRPSTTLET
jgi:hypothetical protein